MLKNSIKQKISEEKLETSGKNQKFSEKIGNFRKKSEIFGKNQKFSEKIGTFRKNSEKIQNFSKKFVIFLRALRAQIRGGLGGGMHPPLKFHTPP